jgi:SSS family solute:Na+ symporter
VVLVPLIATIYGYRKGGAGFAAGAAAGILAALSWDYLLGKPAGIEGLVAGVFANLAVFSLMPGTKPRTAPAG